MGSIAEGSRRPSQPQKYMYSTEQLGCLQSAAEILLIPLWKLLFTFSGEHVEPSPSNTSDASHAQIPRYTPDQLFTLQSASEILGVDLWKLLQHFHCTSIQTAAPPTPSQDSQVQNNSSRDAPETSLHLLDGREADVPDDYYTLPDISSLADVFPPAENITGVTDKVDNVPNSSSFGPTDIPGTTPTAIPQFSTVSQSMVSMSDLFASADPTIGDGIIITPSQSSFFDSAFTDVNDPMDDQSNVSLLPLTPLISPRLDALLSGPGSEDAAARAVPAFELPIENRSLGLISLPSHTSSGWISDVQDDSQGFACDPTENNFPNYQSTLLGFPATAFGNLRSSKFKKPTAPRKKNAAIASGQVSKAAHWCRRSCIRCRFNKRPCLPNPSNPRGPCLECEGVSYTMANLPCLRYLITDVVLFRTMVDPISSKPYKLLDPNFTILNPIRSWNSFTIKVIELTQGYGAPLRLSVHSFSPADIKSDDIPPSALNMFKHPYGLVNLDEAEQTIRRFVSERLRDYFTQKVDESDLITTLVFKMAFTIRNQVHTSLLQDVLQLWVTARFVEGGWHFTGSETLDLAADGAGKIPLTSSPIIDYQVSAIIVQRLLLPLSGRVLRELQRLALLKKHTNWLVIFLSSFILLHSYGLLMKQQRKFSLRRKAPVRYTNMSLVRSIHVGAKTILAHFHYLNKGQGPFELDWSLPEAPRQVAKIAELDTDKVKFIRFIVGEVRKQAHFTSLMSSHAYETDHWFTSQLFVPKWTPPDTLEHSPPV